MKKKPGKKGPKPTRRRNGQAVADSAIDRDNHDAPLGSNVPDTDSIQLNWNGPFRFLDLPAELRLSVYSQLLPHDKVISFEIIEGPMVTWEYDCRRHRNLKKAEIKVEDLGPAGYANTYWKVLSWDRKDQTGPGEPIDIRPGKSLFFVNKFLLNEANGVLYGLNTYHLNVDGLSHSHHAIALQSPHILGPLGHELRVPVLRNIRSITLFVVAESGSHWVNARHRARLDYLVDILKQHADDANQRSVLKKLTVSWRREYYPEINPRRFMFALESLARLRGIEEVNITGVVPWFRECLELCIKGKGGDVKELDWPLKRVTRKNFDTHTKKKVWVSARKWYHPLLDWPEFAERNGITAPLEPEEYPARAYRLLPEERTEDTIEEEREAGYSSLDTDSDL